MKISLISPYSDITALGIRYLSSSLKSKGFSVRLVFIPETRPELGDLGDSWGADEEIVCIETAKIIADSDIIGLSLMSNYLLRSIALSNYLRKNNKNQLIIWGGIHPTIKPDECLPYADAICLGEAEHAITELATLFNEGKDFTISENFWFNKSGKKIINKVSPLETNLDNLPAPDFDIEDDYLFSFKELNFQKIDAELLADGLNQGYISSIRNNTAYQTITTRGCPHNCTYCCNNSLRGIYGNNGYLRRRSNNNIIEELYAIKQKYSFVNEIGFSDDSFFAASLSTLKDFTKLYSEKIDLPFFCLGSPTTITYEKMEILVKAGMYGIQMGIQTGSKKTLQLYRRHFSNSQVLKAAKIINRFKKQIIPPTYDIIIDNPYENYRDNLQTFKLLLSLPLPYHVQIFSLVFFPETELYNKALSDGIITESENPEAIKEYHHRKGTYSNLVFSLFARNAPRLLLRFLSNPLFLFIFSSSFMAPLFKIAYFYFKKLKSTIKTK